MIYFRLEDTTLDVPSILVTLLLFGLAVVLLRMYDIKTARTTQEVFNIILDSGMYVSKPDYVEVDETSMFMCHCILYARDLNLITSIEEKQTIASIAEYIKDRPRMSLAEKLKKNNLPNSYQDRLAIYRDWANKPKLED